MILRRPAYYDRFACLGGACPDSCCHSWVVDVDEESARRYLALQSPLGERLRQVLRQEEEGWCMELEGVRCPMWDGDGLCRIQKELGHGGLCSTCREFPRISHRYGTFREELLELSCPEAARLILEEEGPWVETAIEGDEAPDYDGGAMAYLLKTRQAVLERFDRPGSPEEKLLFMLRTAYPGGERKARREEFLGFFRGLEALTEQWPRLLGEPKPHPMDPRTVALARYLVCRYWLQAVSDGELAARAALIGAMCLLPSLLEGDFIRVCQLMSKELENDPDNMEALLEGPYTCSALHPGALMAMLEEGLQV